MMMNNNKQTIVTTKTRRINYYLFRVIALMCNSSFVVFLMMLTNDDAAAAAVVSGSSELYNNDHDYFMMSSSSSDISSSTNYGGRARIVVGHETSSSSSSSHKLRLQQQHDEGDSTVIDWDAYHVSPTSTGDIVEGMNSNNMVLVDPVTAMTAIRESKKKNKQHHLLSHFHGQDIQVALPLLQAPPQPPEGEIIDMDSPLLHHKSLLRKTGTTICGVAGRDYVVLGADTRATSATTVADKRAAKLHPLAANVWAAGAGTSGDLEHVTRSCHYQLKLRAAVAVDGDNAIGNSNRREETTPQTVNDNGDDDEDDDITGVVVPTHVASSVSAACRILQNMLLGGGGGQVQANLIVGGIHPVTGRATLRALHPHGSMDENLRFTALGSGGLAAMAVLEQAFFAQHDSVKRGDEDYDSPDYDLPLEQAIELVKNAIRAGIENDLGSGSQVDLCIMTTKQKGDDGGKTHHHHDRIGIGGGTTIYQRCAVPEQELAALPEATTTTTTTTTTIQDQSLQETSLEAQPPRIVSPPHQEEVQAKEELWTRVLGL